MKYVLALFMLFSINAAYAGQKVSGIEGKYDCKGTEVGSNESFSCTTELKKTGSTYAMTSNCTDGSSYVGTGIYNQAKRTYSFAFINPKDSSETGVTMGELGKDNVVRSTWTYLNKTKVGHCACNKHNDDADQG